MCNFNFKKSIQDFTEVILIQFNDILDRRQVNQEMQRWLFPDQQRLVCC